MSVQQKAIRGENSIDRIAYELIQAGCHSVFLITGRHFLQHNPLRLFPGFTVNHFLKSGTDVREDEKLSAYKQYLKDPAPTTSGSGSEATHFAVIYRQKIKYSLVHYSLLPRLVILDHSLTYSLTAYQTAVSGMDSFSQAVESFWSINATEESKQLAVESIMIWQHSFLKAVLQPDADSRNKMLWASHLAGMAINTTKTTGPHAISYYLTINHSVPHGQAVSLFLPVFFLYNTPLKELCSVLQVADEYEAISLIQEIMKNAGMAIKLSELGLKKEIIIDELLLHVNEERFDNNPVLFDRDKLKLLILKHL
jgi:alcohol dehydrogenase